MRDLFEVQSFTLSSIGAKFFDACIWGAGLMMGAVVAFPFAYIVLHVLVQPYVIAALILSLWIYSALGVADEVLPCSAYPIEDSSDLYSSLLPPFV